MPRDNRVSHPGERDSVARPEWHFVTCEYPPQVGGVSDYTMTMAKGLAESGHASIVWCPAADGPAPHIAGVDVRPTLGGFALHDLWRTGRAMSAVAGPRRLFVQWVPHGYGYRSVNVAMACWVALRAWVHGDEVHLMVHEAFMSFVPRPLHAAAAALQRVMLAVAASGAHRIWVSHAGWIERIRPFVRSSIPVQWLPVPAPPIEATPEGTLPDVVANLRREGRPIVGHFSTHSRQVTPILEGVLDTVLDRSDAAVLLIGRDSRRFLAGYLERRTTMANRIVATGTLDLGTVGACVSACDLLVQPYPDGVTARRTSTLALLAAGRPVVTNSGRLTERFWRAEEVVAAVDACDGTTIGRAAVALLQDPEQQAILAQHARDCYDRRFAVRHALAILLQAGGAHTGPAANAVAVGSTSRYER